MTGMTSIVWDGTMDLRYAKEKNSFCMVVGGYWYWRDWCRSLLILFSFAISLPILAATDELPSSVKQKLLQSGIPQHAIGVYVQEIGAVKPTLAINADQAMNPASVMKLLTTYAGLELLGPAYTWPTRIFGH